MTSQSGLTAIAVTEQEIKASQATMEAVKRELYRSYLDYDRQPSTTNFRKLTSCMLAYQEQANKIMSLQEKLTWQRSHCE